MNLFEESARVPLIIAVPGAQAKVGAASPRIVELVDLYPTVADLCALPAPTNLAGTTLRPLLEDPNHEWDKPALTQVTRDFEGRRFTGRTIRTERWRYTEWAGGDEGVELYDHQTDPQERTNLARRPEHSGQITQLRARLVPPRRDSGQ